MFEEYSSNSMHLDTLTLAGVAEKIYVKDDQTAKKWLKEKGIKIHSYPKHSYVFQVEVASEIDKPYVIQLRNQYPDKWKEKYRDVVKDIAVYNLTVSKIEDTPTPTPTVRARRINKKDEERYKRLLG